MKLILSILFICSFSVQMFSQEFADIAIEKSVKLNIPIEFILMNDDAIAERYITTKRPVALYSNPAGNVDIGVNKSVTQWQSADIDIMKDFYKANIQSLYDEVRFSKDTLVVINGREFAVFEFESVVRDASDALIQRAQIRKYTYIQYTIVNGVTWVFNLTAPAGARNQWSEKANVIMNSISIKK
jgi:hypothetical protein